MSGGLPSTGLPPSDSTATIRYDAKDPADPSINPQSYEAIRRKRASLGPVTPEAPNLADMAIKDSMSGKVRKARAGSMADSLLGQWGGFLVLVGIVGMGWVRAVLRGDVW